MAAIAPAPLTQNSVENANTANSKVPRMTAVRRRNIRGVAPEPATRIEEGDVLVLLGAEGDLAAAEMKLLQG